MAVPSLFSCEQENTLPKPIGNQSRTDGTVTGDPASLMTCEQYGGLRDFILFALLSGISAFASEQFNTFWILIAGFIGFISLLFSGYWADYVTDKDRDTGITSEAAAILTFFLGVLIIKDAQPIAIALAIVTLAILSQSDKLRPSQQRV
jgi:uncharacterized membrane protein (DUF4010 family)